MGLMAFVTGTAIVAGLIHHLGVLQTVAVAILVFLLVGPIFGTILIATKHQRSEAAIRKTKAIASFIIEILLFAIIIVWLVTLIRALFLE